MASVTKTDYIRYVNMLTEHEKMVVFAGDKNRNIEKDLSRVFSIARSYGNFNASGERELKDLLDYVMYCCKHFDQ
jgi:hypothetical protein